MEIPMSAIPYPLDPLGRCSPYFEVVVKPGILNASLDYDIFAVLNTGDYLKVVDWGDGTSSEAAKSGVLTHTYSQAGTYTVRIKGNCQRIQFGYTHAPIVYDTNANWSALGNLTTGYRMFDNCSNAQFKIDKLPESLQDIRSMFSKCYYAKLHIHKLPAKLSSCIGAFDYCYRAVIDLDELAANAPAEGWTEITDITRMFYKAGSLNVPGTVTGSRSAFLAKLPKVRTTTNAFYDTNTTE